MSDAKLFFSFNWFGTRQSVLDVDDGSIGRYKLESIGDDVPEDLTQPDIITNHIPEIQSGFQIFFLLGFFQIEIEIDLLIDALDSKLIYGTFN
jgi:hypothetical protein